MSDKGSLFLICNIAFVEKNLTVFVFAMLRRIQHYFIRSFPYIPVSCFITDFLLYYFAVFYRVCAQRSESEEGTHHHHFRHREGKEHQGVYCLF